MTKMTRHWRRWIAVPIVLLLLAVVAWRFWPQPAVSGGQSQWLRVEPQLLENRLGLTGRIQAATHLTLAAPFEGVIKEVLATEGQRVEKGQPLLVLDTSLLDVQVRQALAGLLKTQRTMQDLQHWEQSQEVARARRTLNNTRNTLANTEASLKDTRTLFERGIVARMEVDSLEQQAQTQRQDLAAAREELRITLEKGHGEERQIAEMELANAQARYQALLTLQAQRVVRAPFAGVLMRPTMPEAGKWQPIQAGARITPGIPLFDIIDPGQLQAIASIEEADLHQLSEGMPVDIDGDGFAGLTLNGNITTIGIEGRSTESEGAGARYDVLIAIDPLAPEQRRRLRLGMSARLSVVTYRNERGIAVPSEALRTDEAGNRYVVFRPDAASAPQRITVTPGLAVLQGVEITGLTAGEVEISKNN